MRTINKQFRKFIGKFEDNSYGNKPFLDYEGESLFAAECRLQGLDSKKTSIEDLKRAGSQLYR